MGWTRQDGIEDALCGSALETHTTVHSGTRELPVGWTGEAVVRVWSCTMLWYSYVSGMQEDRLEGPWMMYSGLRERGEYRGFSL